MNPSSIGSVGFLNPTYMFMADFLLSIFDTKQVELIQKKDEKKCCNNNHKMEDCKSEQRCNNCAEFNKKNKKNVDEKHSIFDKKNVRVIKKP